MEDEKFYASRWVGEKRYYSCFSSGSVMVSSEELLEKVYREVLAIRERLDSLERKMIPEVGLSEEEMEELRMLKKEADEGQTVPWDEVKTRLRKRRS